MPDADRARYTGSLAIAWAGAAVFGLALLVAAYSYGVGFDQRPASRPPAAAIAADIALFSAFALHHSLFARTGLKQLVMRLVPPELERSAYTWIASLLFLAVCLGWQSIDVSVYEIRQPWRSLAYLVQLTGVVVTVRASAKLDTLDLAGVRQVQRARDGSAPGHVALETTGLYGFVRHPLYFAWVLLVFGAPSMTATRLTFAVVSTIYLALAIPWEERGLVQVFGASYETYRHAVRWRMLPGLY